jgi:hypothetical protein
MENYTTVTSYMLTMLPYVDVFAGTLYPDTVAKRALGIGFTQEILDASLVLVTTQSTVDSPLDVSSNDRSLMIVMADGALLPARKRRCTTVIVFLTNPLTHYTIFNLLSPSSTING